MTVARRLIPVKSRIFSPCSSTPNGRNSMYSRSRMVVYFGYKTIVDRPERRSCAARSCMTEAPFAETRGALRAPVTGALSDADYLLLAYCLMARFRVFSRRRPLATNRPDYPFDYPPL